jgi:hypothetical protein
MKVAVSLTLLPRVVFSFKTVGYNFVANSRYVEWRDAVLNGNEHVFGSKPVGIELYDYEKDPLERENLAGKVEYQKVLQEHQDLFDLRLSYLPKRSP